jgi:AraC-like DNA-binding protein
MAKQQDFILVDRGLSDLNPLTMGAQACEPGYRFGPTVRPYYLLHYVMAGRGRLMMGGKEYTIEAGGYFLIRPGEAATYEADREEPWHYFWIHFTGNLAARLDALPSPVGRLSRATMQELYQAAKTGFAGWEGAREEYVTSVLHRIVAEMLVNRPSHAHYARRAQTYIRTMYMQDISVESIAASLSLNRRYLSRLFKERYGVTMQDYLVSVRLEAAAKLLSDGYTVSESAHLCGYRDPFNFSKMFHRHYGTSPREYAAERGGRG